MNKPYNKWEVLFNSNQIYDRVRELATDISTDFGDQPFTVVCVLDGALFFGVDLLRHFDFDTKDNQVRFEVVKASSYVGTQSRRIQFDPLKLTREKIEGKRILLIDDILETGQTLSTVRDFIAGHDPLSLKITAFLVKKGRQQFPISLDYSGFLVENPEYWLVGYGLDDDSRYRNLKDIRIMPQHHAGR